VREEPGGCRQRGADHGAREVEEARGGKGLRGDVPGPGQEGQLGEGGGGVGGEQRLGRFHGRSRPVAAGLGTVGVEDDLADQAALPQSVRPGGDAPRHPFVVRVVQTEPQVGGGVQVADEPPPRRSFPLVEEVGQVLGEDRVKVLGVCVQSRVHDARAIGRDGQRCRARQHGRGGVGR
jgi:hypothetical protein